MIWEPKPLWLGSDAYIIGGGPSLKTFDWELLLGEMTIGINSAYRLGRECCSICFFGDEEFFQQHQAGLKEYGGPVFTNCENLLNTDCTFLYTLRRRREGLHKDGLGWGNNSGVAALNLALLLGSKRVMLLGFDMKAPSIQNWNWHTDTNPENKQELFDRFKAGFKRACLDWKRLFPDQEIINVNDDSELEFFPRVGVKEWFNHVRFES